MHRYHTVWYIENLISEGGIDMKYLAFNGSPRKGWNTETVLKYSMKGAASQGFSTELIHLYDYDYKGCRSCFACKLKDGKSYGRCAIKDDLTAIHNKIETADAIVIGSPIYFGDVTGTVRAFMERLLFPYLVYDNMYSTLFPKKLPVGLIYTMNVTQEKLKAVGYKPHLTRMEQLFERILGPSKSLYVTDTYQFTSYSNYVVTSFNEKEKAKRKKEEFPKDCQKAFDLGVSLAVQAYT